MKRVVIGILAHVDAGKTTLSESMLYLTGEIRSAGRVDHGDAFLDNYELERERGITIFAKQAGLKFGDMEVTLLDTPGHVDFGAEMERTLQVLDYAILVISGTDGVQSHTETLWKLLKSYNIPTYLFVNKMDITNLSREELISNLRKNLSEGIVDFENIEAVYEDMAVNDEEALEKYLDASVLSTEDISRLVHERKVFPCFFGSALKMSGVEEMIQNIEKYTVPPEYDNSGEVSARIYKISRDEQGTRLTWLKVTNGSIKVKDEIEHEKINQIRIYSGAGYKTADHADVGEVCAVTGLTKTYAGQGVGSEKQNETVYMQPVLDYVIEAEDCADLHGFYLKLKQLEEEEPMLHIVWNESHKEILARLMGEVQLEVLKRLIHDRFKVNVTFGEGSIVYRETICDTVEGVGHFEPLKHYAEVHLIMEPLERGSGIEVESTCSEDVLDRNWQRLIITHLLEKQHIGVLTGSEITDVKITLVAGKAHIKHTEGGDFRQATYRAVRQGLKSAKSVLLEPYYSFKLDVPSDNLGRALNDIQAMDGKFDAPDIHDGRAVICGSAPVSLMQGYMREVMSYTKGAGRLSVSFKGYDICHNAEEVIQNIGYDSEKDVENPTGSVFCAHGAGYNVPWNEVKDHMHIPFVSDKKNEPEADMVINEKKESSYSGVSLYDDGELKEIFERTYGKLKTKLPAKSSSMGYEKPDTVQYRNIMEVKRDEYLLVDGYNMIFTNDELNTLAKDNLEAARGKLMDILCNYQGFKQCTVILVFDAYKVKGNLGEVQKYNNIYVVYTKEAETADMYIEKTVHNMNKKYDVTVATSDGLEQLIIMGQGAKRISSREFMLEVEAVNERIRNEFLDKGGSVGNQVIKN